MFYSTWVRGTRVPYIIYQWRTDDDIKSKVNSTIKFLSDVYHKVKGNKHLISDAQRYFELLGLELISINDGLNISYNYQYENHHFSELLTDQLDDAKEELVHK